MEIFVNLTLKCLYLAYLVLVFASFVRICEGRTTNIRNRGHRGLAQRCVCNAQCESGCCLISGTQSTCHSKARLDHRCSTIVFRGKYVGYCDCACGQGICRNGYCNRI
uniref:Ixodegrin B n=1 Tax=Rhipicephalus appendiculatus TaxID=34631 RepID=A0A131Z7E7_RHIAP